jgi:hypothetical protein
VRARARAHRVRIGVVDQTRSRKFLRAVCLGKKVARGRSRRQWHNSLDECGRGLNNRMTAGERPTPTLPGLPWPTLLSALRMTTSLGITTYSRSFVRVRWPRPIKSTAFALI